MASAKRRSISTFRRKSVAIDRRFWLSSGLVALHTEEQGHGWGRVRHLDNPDGQTIVERLEKYDFAGRTYSYSILQAPFPVTGYLATITVTPPLTVRDPTSIGQEHSRQKE